jgi:glyoxylase-like metal-dependent hydrolase (beta-lactamase superfamily II)
LLAGAGCAVVGESRTPPSPGSASVHPRIDIAQDLYVREVTDRVVVVTHSFPWPANSLIARMESSDLVLVDTPYTPEATRELLEWIVTRFGEYPIIAINTGYHHDNLGGNGCLIERGIPVYGSDLTARLLRERGESMRTMTLSWLQAPEHERYREAHAVLPYVPPTNLFDLDEGLELDFGRERVLVHHPGASHSPDNSVVYFPGLKLLFGGCMILGWDGVGNTSDADLEAWPKAIRNLRRFDLEIVVPGHGDRLDPGLLDHTIELLVRHSE